MTGINRKLTSDPRINLVLKHLPNTLQAERLLRKEGKAYVFNDQEAMELVTQAIIEGGERTGIENETDNHERYGLYFPEPIGYLLKADGSQTPLYYAEIKIIKGTDIYHVIPRNRPRRTDS